jgi:hypothetical protein
MMERRQCAENVRKDTIKRELGGAGFISRITIVALTSFVLQIEPSAAASTCTNLSSFSLPQTKITLARLYRAAEVVSGVTKAGSVTSTVSRVFKNILVRASGSPYE